MSILTRLAFAIAITMMLGACSDKPTDNTTASPTPVRSETPAVSSTPEETFTPEAAPTPETSPTLAPEQSSTSSEEASTKKAAPGIVVTGDVEVKNENFEKATSGMDPDFVNMVKKQR